MQRPAEEIAAAFASGSPVSRSRVMTWWRDAQDTETRAALYEGVTGAYDQIRLPLGWRRRVGSPQGTFWSVCVWTRKERVCIVATKPHWSSRGWFDHMADSEQEEAPAIMRETAAAITALYLNGGQDVQSAIETGFLEHVLEQERLRTWFAHWATDDRLSESWHAALSWGEAHPNFVKSLRENLSPHDEGNESGV